MAGESKADGGVVYVTLARRHPNYANGGTYGREGIRFGVNPTPVDLSKLTDDQVKLIRDDPYLVIEDETQTKDRAAAAEVIARATTDADSVPETLTERLAREHADAAGDPEAAATATASDAKTIKPKTPARKKSGRKKAPANKKTGTKKTVKKNAATAGKKKATGKKARARR